MEKLTNDQNIKNLLIRKKLRIIIIILGFLTITLAILDLYYRNWLFLTGAIISFVISAVLTKKRDSIKIKRNEKLEDVEYIINKKRSKKG